MRVTEFQLGCSKTVNLQNYNSIRVEARVTIDVPEGEDLGLLRKLAQEELKSMMEQTYRIQMKKDTE